MNDEHINFHDTRLPDWFEILCLSRTNFSTSIASSASGREVRSSDFDEPMHEYIFNSCLLSSGQFKILNDFFKARSGRRYSFRFRDHGDYQVKNQYIATGDGEQNIFQLYKIYYDSVAPSKRKITKLVKDSVKIYFSEGDVQFKVDLLSGVITFDAPLKQGVKISADFTFDAEVRFGLDKYEYQYRQDGSIEIQNLYLIECN